MGDSERDNAADRETGQTERERALAEKNVRLLEELESAYLQMEAYLMASQEEADVAYRELERKNRQLERRLLELEQTHAELREAERQLVHSERLAAMGQLAASIVHELRNPLTIIRGRIQLLLMSKKRDEEIKRKTLGIVLEQSERLADLVSNILSFSRKQEIRVRPVQINTVLDDLLTFLLGVKGKRIEIHTDFVTDLPLLRGDPNQLQQVFMNLILNAFDAMKGEGTLNIATSLTDMASVVSSINASRSHVLAFDPDQMPMKEHLILVEISDEGPGIPESHLQRIFEAFYTTKEEGAGTGLGLAICRSIVEKYEGNILITSSMGAGSIASVLLPAEPSGERRIIPC